MPPLSFFAQHLATRLNKCRTILPLAINFGLKWRYAWISRHHNISGRPHRPVFFAAPGASGASAQGTGEIQLAQTERRQGGVNRYKDQIRRFLHLARNGDAYALRQIGFHYARGWGVIRDYTKAYMWFTLAGQEGNQDALENRATIAGNLTADQIARADAMAAQWLETHEWEIDPGSFGG